MYDTTAILQAIDRNAIPVLGLCGFAMACNYYYFIAAALRGFKDKAYPLPVFGVLFWLCGDGSFVLDYDLAFNVIDHWYVKLFWLALLFTVAFEVLYLYMIIRFGRKEIAPSMSQTQFVAAILGGLVLMATAWTLIKALINDPLAINYFHLANMAGPPFAWALYNRRGSRAGTTPSVWLAYTGVVLGWTASAAFFFGAPFNSPPFLLLYLVTIASCIAVTFKVMRLPPVQRIEGELIG